MAAKIEWPRGRQRCAKRRSLQEERAGSGAAVTARLLDDGWRVVVPWIVEAELERVQQRDGLELVKADLFDPAGVAEAVALARAATRDAPAARRRQPGRRVSRPASACTRPRSRTFEEQFRLNLRPTYLVTQAALPALIAAGGGSIVCVGYAGGAAAVRGRGRLRGLQGGGARVRARGRGRVPRRRRPLQRDPPERDRHAGQPRARCRTPTTTGGSSRPRSRA